MTDGTAGDVTIDVQSSGTAANLTFKVETELCGSCRGSGTTTCGFCLTCWGEGYVLKIE